MSEGFILEERKKPVAPHASWFRGARIGRCFFCGLTDATYDIKAASPDYRCCRRCIETRGLESLKSGANEALSALAALGNKSCRHCGEAVLAPPKGFPPLVCSACWDELGRIK